MDMQNIKRRTTPRAMNETPIVIRCCLDVGLKPGERWGPVIRSNYVFECCTKGRGTVIVNGKEFSIGAGDAYILFPGDIVTHTTDVDDPREGISCFANGLTIGRVLKRIGIASTQPFFPEHMFHNILAVLTDILNERTSKNLSSDMHCTAHLYHLFGILLQDTQQTDPDTIIQKIIGTIESNYNKRLTINQLADSVGFERSYFSTFFKNQTGMPPHQYLTKVRIQKACELLERTNLTIASIAESVGLDPLNFSRLFKRETGTTPTQYKQRHHSKK